MANSGLDRWSHPNSWQFLVMGVAVGLQDEGLLSYHGYYCTLRRLYGPSLVPTFCSLLGLSPCVR